MSTDPTSLDQTFTFTSTTHTYTLHWTSLGSSQSASDPAVIFIHGTPWSSRVWAPYALALSFRYRVYLFDNPGYGMSLGGQPLGVELGDSGDEDRIDVSLAGQAEAFAALFKSWNLTAPPHIVAHDIGGLIFLRAHLLHGCEYASLCLVDVVAVRPFGSLFFRLVAANPDVFNQIPARIFEGLVRAYVTGAAFKLLRGEVLDMLVVPWVEGGSQGQKAFIRQMIQADQQHAEEVEGMYGEVGRKMPVKIIWGREDAWIPVDRSRTLGGMIGTEDIVVVEEAGHLIHYDQPERLGIELGLWLSKVKQRRNSE